MKYFYIITQNWLNLEFGMLLLNGASLTSLLAHLPPSLTHLQQFVSQLWIITHLAVTTHSHRLWAVLVLFHSNRTLQAWCKVPISISDSGSHCNNWIKLQSQLVIIARKNQPKFNLCMQWCVEYQCNIFFKRPILAHTALTFSSCIPGNLLRSIKLDKCCPVKAANCSTKASFLSTISWLHPGENSNKCDFNFFHSADFFLFFLLFYCFFKTNLKATILPL